jgi:hypothetical protein
LYNVLKNHPDNTIPEAGMAMIRWGLKNYVYLDAGWIANGTNNKTAKSSLLLYGFPPILFLFYSYFIRRYHSFYPWHTGGAYASLECAKDAEYKAWVLDFNKYDLYTKSEAVVDVAALKAYYTPIAEKYLGAGPIYW